MLDNYTAFNHMWAVDGRDDIYSSRLDAFIATDSDELQDWLIEMPGRVVGNIASLEELHEVLVNAGVGERHFGDVNLWRAKASMQRGEFINGAADLGLMTDDEAIEAVRGGWPASFNAALPDDASLARRAKVDWAGATEINRNAPLIAGIIAATPITEEQVDVLFGWTG